MARVPAIPRRAPSDREKQVLANRLLHGRKEGSRVLGISPATMRNHLTTLYRKLGVENGVEASIALGWTEIPDDLVHTHDRPGRLAPDEWEQAEWLLFYARALLDAVALSDTSSEQPDGREAGGQGEGAGAPSPNCTTCLGFGCAECCNTGRSSIPVALTPDQFDHIEKGGRP